ncbi:shTK domain protein [Oesophagostomum dentatum]|uniref:ShTK domain protein n=1 Tax=Oesophagostomum dentatum TaxID=61180 RepID=A0A0B1TM09_OESDE|nr:shTK domain protein [Oesophagostomum dentatum]
MSRFIPLFLLYALSKNSYSRYFDVCPSRKISIGACLAGLCPLGSECINNYCCKTKTVTTTPETENVEEFGKCRGGQDAIGECVSELCPSGYVCSENLCCGNQTATTEASTKESMERTTTTTVVRAKTFKPFTNEPSTMESSSEPTTTSGESMEVVEIVDLTMDSTTPQIDGEDGEGSTEDEDEEATRWIETTTADMTEIESIRSSFRVLKSKESNENEESLTTTTERSTDYETEEEKEEIQSILSTSTSTTTSTTTHSKPDTSTSRGATANLKTTTTTQQPQICPVGESIGECISDQCPEGHTCFRNTCCIVTPQINCTDALSGCLPHLCDKRGYKEFTTTNCARTCARCHVSELASKTFQYFMLCPSPP